MLINVSNPALEVDTGTDGAKHLVACAENALEQLKFFGQQFVDPCIRLVAAVDEVHHHHVMLLAVPVAASDTLLYALWVPGKVVVDHQRAKLQVDAFSPRLGGNHDGAALLEVLDKCGTSIGSLGAGDSITPSMALQPVLINALSRDIRIGAIKQHDAIAISCIGQQRQKVVLGAPRLGEDDSLASSSKAVEFGKGTL
ncbi:hypothetical protein D3C79_617810 [compost metagenome]